MGNVGKSILMVSIGFVIGVAATLLWRREARPSAVPPKVPPVSHSQVPDSKTQSPAPDTAKRIASVESLETPTPPAQPKDDIVKASGTQATDEERLQLGRPKKPDFNEILKAPTWEEFYKQCKEHKLWGEDYETAVFRKMVQVLGLDTERSEALNKLFKAEQLAAARAISDSAGGLAGLDKKMEELIHDGTKAALKEWRRIREDVRLTHNNDYLKVLSYQELALFNEHMRNEEIEPVRYHSNEGTNYHIGGVGKPPK
ncbi:MAG TPA: hypothetical protein VGK61_02505 [Planctomycetota bacterium]|jgi:hypothetical protein